MKFFVPAALVFAGLTTVALAGSPPSPEAAQGCGCKPVVVVEAPACTGAKKSCAGEKESCSGRTTFVQRRAARQEDRQEARAERACARAEARCGGNDCCESACDCCPEQEVRVVFRGCPSTCN